MEKEDVEFIYTGILSSQEKKEIQSLVTTWIDLDGVTLSEMSEKDIVRYQLSVESRKGKLPETELNGDYQ